MRQLDLEPTDKTNRFHLSSAPNSYTTIKIPESWRREHCCCVFYRIGFVVVTSRVFDDKDMLSLANQLRRRWRMETDLARLPSAWVTAVVFIHLLLVSHLHSQLSPACSDSGFVLWSSDSDLRCMCDSCRVMYGLCNWLSNMLISLTD